MYFDNRQNKVKKVVTLIAFCLLCVIVLGLMVAFYVKNKDSKNENINANSQTGTVVALDGEGNELKDNLAYEMPSILYFLEKQEGVVSQVQLYVSLDTDKETSNINYSLSWGVIDENETLTPDAFVKTKQNEKGGQVVTVTLVKEFCDKEIRLTATTTDGEFVDMCTILYQITANSIAVSSSETPIIAEDGTEYYALKPENTYVFDIELKSQDGYNVNKYDLEYLIGSSITSIFVGDCFIDESGKVTYDENSFKQVSLYDKIDELIKDIWIVDNKLYITMGSTTFDNYYLNKSVRDGGVEVQEKIVLPSDFVDGDTYANYGISNQESLKGSYIQVLVREKIVGSLGYGFYIYYGG